MPGMYEPISSKLAIVRSRISPESWAARVETAREAAKVMQAISVRVEGEESLNKAIQSVVPKSRRSWVIAHWQAFRREGLEALIDARVPREPILSRACEGIIQGARMASPKVTVDEVLSILRKQRVPVLPSASTVKQHFARVDARQRYAAQKERAGKKEVVELPLAGGELLVAAEQETGIIAALTQEVESLAEEARQASAGQTPERDVKHRDDRGHFTATYNRKRRRKPVEQVARYLRSAAEKAEGRVPSWPRFVHERTETLEPKLRMLTFAPLVSATQGWDALRAPEAAGIEPLTGFAYMPSTLAKLTSALAISGAGPRMLERVGLHWHAVAQERWGEAGGIAALYVDNHAKEVWTSLFTQSGKVSSLNRVMPCITTTYVHTGAGTPVVASVQSGAAPLAPRLLELVETAEEQLGGEVRRATVIDAEGSTFDVLEAFANKGRVIVTPLRPSRAPGLELKYSRGSYFRPYREKDELRVATAVLTKKSTGQSLELGALVVRRAHRDSDTVLLTTGLQLGFEGRELADLYFARWPVQENAFKDGTAVGLDEHRGNCGTMVANVAVVTELERLERRAQADEESRQKLSAQRAAVEGAQEQARSEHQQAMSALAVRRRRLDELVALGRSEGKQLGRAAVEHQGALARAEQTQRAYDGAQQALAQHRAAQAELEAAIEKNAARRAKLEPQRTIRKLDVALDSVLTSTKLALALLLSFVLREYLPAMPMTPHTFISRVLGIRGRREVDGEEETVVFYESKRDPGVNAALADACARLNKRGLRRNGKRLRYRMHEADSVDSKHVSVWTG